MNKKQILIFTGGWEVGSLLQLALRGVVGPEDGTATVDDDLVTLLDNDLENDLCLILVISWDLPHPGLESVARIDGGGESARDGLQGIGIGLTKRLEDSMGGMAIGAESVQNWLFESDLGRNRGIDMEGVIITVGNKKDKSRVGGFVRNQEKKRVKSSLL